MTTDGPTKANIDEQITFIDNYVTRGVDGILFAANDPVAIAPVLKKALGKGINVVGYDANSTPDAREWFVNQAEFNGIGKALIDQMATEIGEDGAFAIVTSTFTTPNQARWIAEMQAYQEACHPKMKWLETVEAQEDNILSFNQASTLINKYGDDLKGLFGMTSVATPASAEAVTQAKQCGKIAVVGLATPNAMKPYVAADCVKSVVLWNPVDLGYAATYVLRAVADGKLKPGATEVEAGKLGKLQVVNGSEILLGPPFVYNKSQHRRVRLLSRTGRAGCPPRSTGPLEPAAAWRSRSSTSARPTPRSILLDEARRRPGAALARPARSCRDRPTRISTSTGSGTGRVTALRELGGTGADRLHRAGGARGGRRADGRRRSRRCRRWTMSIPAPMRRPPSSAPQLDPFAPRARRCCRWACAWARSSTGRSGRFPDAFARATDFLLLPQYWAWRLCGVKATEVTSLGAHTHLWRPAEGRFSDLCPAARLGEAVPAACGGPGTGWARSDPELAAATGLPPGLPGARRDPRQQRLLPAASRRARRRRSPCSRPAPGSSPWRPGGRSTGWMRRPTCWPMSMRAASRCRPPGSWAGARSSWWRVPTRCAPQAGPADVAAIVADGGDGAAELRRRQRAVHRPAGQIVGDPGAEPARRAALAALYAALTVDVMLDKLGSAGPVLVEGSFHRNAAFCGLLAALRPDQALHATDDPSGTARGAWLLAHWQNSPVVPANLPPPVQPWRVEGLTRYRSSWLAASRDDCK